MSQYLAVVGLSNLDGTNGFQINGEAAYDESGFSVSSAGDVNGDGIDDMLVGAKFATTNGTGAGASYVVFGRISGFGAALELSALDGNNGFQISGEAAQDYSGDAVRSAGDVNGDGFDDVIIGAFAADPNGTYSGASYVVFGKASSFGATFNLSALDGNNGFQINGVTANDISGSSVSSAGDVNGDGFADLVVGANGADPHGNFSGSAYVVFGKGTPFAATFELSALDGNNGFKMNGGLAYDQVGCSVSWAGDVNRDGFDDLIVGAMGRPLGASFGASYVVFGTGSGFAGTLELDSLDGHNGFTIAGKKGGDKSGQSVSSAGDVNGDGFDDVVVGAYAADPHGASSGASYVVFGKAHFHATVKVGKLDGSDGFQIAGKKGGDFSGWSVSSAGDFNGDGFDDIIVGAKFADPNGTSTGASYVVFGKAGFTAVVELSALDGNNGFKINGAAAYDNAGWSVSGAGDVNGDGFADVMVGAHYATPNGLESGASYVIYGGKPAEAVVRTGSAISQTIYGGDFDDTLSGLGGKDTLLGGDGNDHLNGGSGSDTMDGGAGDDVFAYAAVSDSTSAAYDIVKHANFAADQFDVAVAVNGVDATVVTGTLSKASFDTDLAAAVDSVHLALGHAVLFTPDAGAFAGKTFLIIDQNGAAGYQAGLDLVIRLDGANHISNFGAGDFI